MNSASRVLRHQRVRPRQTGRPLHAQPVRPVEGDEQQPHLRIGAEIAQRQVHAVAVVTRESERDRINDTYETWRAALIGHCRPAPRVDGGEEEHVAAFDEALFAGTDFGLAGARLDSIRQCPGALAVLHSAMRCIVQTSHGIGLRGGRGSNDTMRNAARLDGCERQA